MTTLELFSKPGSVHSTFKLVSAGLLVSASPYLNAYADMMSAVASPVLGVVGDHAQAEESSEYQARNYSYSIPDFAYDLQSGILDLGSGYANLSQRIASFRYLRTDWSPYCVEAPNAVAIGNALDALKRIWRWGVLPSKVNPSVEEGIVFEFTRGERFFLLEFYNESEIVYLKREGDAESEVSEVTLEDMDAIAQTIAAA